MYDVCTGIYDVCTCVAASAAGREQAQWNESTSEEAVGGGGGGAHARAAGAALTAGKCLLVPGARRDCPALDVKSIFTAVCCVLWSGGIR
jgi:hypothetical protein